MGLTMGIWTDSEPYAYKQDMQPIGILHFGLNGAIEFP